jgi:hypothetical protein
VVPTNRGPTEGAWARIETLSTSRPEHLYERLVTVLLRLVFLLYAEDRDLIPSRSNGETRALYNQGARPSYRGYGVRSLYSRLLNDAALHPTGKDNGSSHPRIRV